MSSNKEIPLLVAPRMLDGCILLSSLFSKLAMNFKTLFMPILLAAFIKALLFDVKSASCIFKTDLLGSSASFTFHFWLLIVVMQLNVSSFETPFSL